MKENALAPVRLSAQIKLTTRRTGPIRPIWPARCSSGHGSNDRSLSKSVKSFQVFLFLRRISLIAARAFSRSPALSEPRSRCNLSSFCRNDELTIRCHPFHGRHTLACQLNVHNRRVERRAPAQDAAYNGTPRRGRNIGITMPSSPSVDCYFFIFLATNCASKNR